MADLFLLKIGASISIFMLALIFTMIPLKIKSFRSNKTLMSLANSFSAGVFLSAGLLHILPDANKAFEDEVFI